MDPSFYPAIVALHAGDLAALRALVASDPALATRRSSSSHPTLLQMVACEASTLPDALGAARILAGAGAPLAEPLIAAASVDAREILLWLLDRGADVDGTHGWGPLDEALYWCHLALAQILIDRGAAIRSLRAAAGAGDVPAVASFFTEAGLCGRAGPIRSPFPDTVPPDLAHLPEHVIDNAFVAAVNTGQREAAALLLARGARINAKPPGLHWRGTALHAAAWRGDAALIDWLLAQGADPTIEDDHVHSDAAGWAAHHGHAAIARRLSPG